MRSWLTQLKQKMPGKRSAILLACAVLAGVFGVAYVASAENVIGWFLTGLFDVSISTIINTVLYAIVWTLGRIIAVTLIPALIFVASYNDFAVEWGVQVGWTVVRDIANMFFIIVLLVIAVATIFKVESYSYRQLLPKLVIMAILINFSRTITGFFIDISQIIMLTFVNSFKNITAGNLISNLGLDKIFSFSAIWNDEASALAAIGSMVLGVIVTAVSAGILLVLVVVLTFRIIMLWLLTVLSPMAFLLSVFPGGQKYSSQWWEKLTSHLIVGPVLAFFLWLSFTIMENNLWTQRQGGSFERLSQQEQALQGDGISAYNPFGTEQGQLDSMITFVIVIGLLMGSLTITSQLGVLGGAIVGTVSGALGKIGYGAAMFIPTRVGGLIAQKWNERTARLLEAKPGEKVETWKKVAFAALNPVAAYKGWQERTTELKEHAKKTAIAGGREVTEEYRTKGRVMIPYRSQVEGSIEAQFAKDFTVMSKEQKAVAMAKLMHMKKEKPYDPEVGRRIRALLRLAAEGGHWDDILLSEKFIEETGTKYVEKRADGGYDYSFHTVNKWLQDLVGDDREGLRLLDEVTEEISKRNTHSEYAGHASYDDQVESEIFLTGTKALANAITNFGKIQGDRKMSESPHVFMKIGTTAELDKDAFDQVQLDEAGRVKLKKGVRGTGIDDYTRATTRMAFAGKLFNDILRRVQGRAHNMVVGGSGGASNVDAASKYAFINNTTDIERLAEYYKINPDLIRASYEGAGGERGKLQFKVYDQNTGEIKETLDNEVQFVNYLKAELQRQGNQQLASGLKFTAPTSRADLKEDVLLGLATGKYKDLDDYRKQEGKDGSKDEGGENASSSGAEPTTPPGDRGPSRTGGSGTTTTAPPPTSSPTGGGTAPTARPTARGGARTRTSGPATEGVQRESDAGDIGGVGTAGRRSSERELQALTTIDASINNLRRDIEILINTVKPIETLPSGLQEVQQVVESALAERARAGTQGPDKTASQLSEMLKQLKNLQKKKDALQRKIDARLAADEEKEKGSQNFGKKEEEGNRRIPPVSDEET